MGWQIGSGTYIHKSGSKLAKKFREKLLLSPWKLEVFDRNLDLPIYSIHFDFSLSWK